MADKKSGRWTMKENFSMTLQYLHQNLNGVNFDIKRVIVPQRTPRAINEQWKKIKEASAAEVAKYSNGGTDTGGPSQSSTAGDAATNAPAPKKKANSKDTPTSNTNAGPSKSSTALTSDDNSKLSKSSAAKVTAAKNPARKRKVQENTGSSNKRRKATAKNSKGKGKVIEELSEEESESMPELNDDSDTTVSNNGKEANKKDLI